MSNWQERIGSAIKSVTERQEAFVGGVQRGITLGGDTMEKVAGFQIGLASSGVDATVAQVKLLGQPGNPLTYAKRQVELVSDGMQTVTAKAGELKDIASECASDVAALFVVPAPSKPRAKRAA
ncbi:MAG: TIGR01841 family phasin [Pseudomonadota bacterium]